MNDIVVKTDKFEINNKNLVLGKQGENAARQIVFGYSAWREAFGEGELTLFVKRHGEDASYPVVPDIDGTKARWNISSTDTAIYGSGSVELRYVVNNVVVKSETFSTFVYRSITETTAPPPDPYESWVETLVALGDETRIYAERAETAASSAKDHAESAQAAAESAQSYSSHPPRIGEDGNWELWNGTAYVSSAYPSRGETGEKGAKGERGEKGGKGDPGQAGTDGITPHIGENGHWFIGETDTGVSASGIPDVAQFEDIFISMTSPIMRRNIYRGKDLGTEVTDAQRNAIASGTFDGLFIGDYWTINGTKYLIADMDYWYNTGDIAFVRHHLVMIPGVIMYSRKMNESNSTEGGYVGSQMYTEGLNRAKETINAAFGDMVLTHREYLINAVSGFCSSGGAWYDSSVELMNEIMVYGSNIYSNVTNGTTIPNNRTIDKQQLAIFKLNPKEINKKQLVWLRDIVSTNRFAYVRSDGCTNESTSALSCGVRPVFPIG